MKYEDLAIQAIDKMHQHGESWVSTSVLRSRMGLEVSDQAPLRQALLRLVSAGVLEIGTGGKHTWKLRRGAYEKVDRLYPFRKIETTTYPNTTQHYEPIAPVSQNFDEQKLRETLEKEYKEKIDESEKRYTESLDRIVVKYKELQTENSALQIRVNQLVEDIKKIDDGPRTLIIKRPDNTKIKLPKGTTPKCFTKILNLAMCRMNIMLVGPAGAGKTTIAALIAKALDLNFGAVNCTAGMSESHLTGRSRPKLTGKDLFVQTKFLDCYENGGVFLLDELDAADSNLLLIINTALANGYCNVPNRDDNPVAEKSEDFICIATANTVGRGSDRMYVGRAQLDAATLDRFQIGMVPVTYSLEVEEGITVEIAKTANGKASQIYNSETRQYVPKFNEDKETEGKRTAKMIAEKGYDLLETLWYVRDRIDGTTGMRRVMSTRFIKDACIMMRDANWTKEDILEAFFCGWSDEEIAKIGY